MTVTLKIRSAVEDAMSDRTSRVYFGIVAVLAIWASAGNLGLVESSWMVRFLAVILCMPWTFVASVMIYLSHVEERLLGYSFYHEAPAWLFEPLWTVFWLSAAFANARIIAALSRSASRRPGVSPLLVPTGLLAFFGLIVLIWRA
ncbi:SCO4225 family membrane protein [Streptomyces prasinus]|uniref:SCO4225 family membrane protein n=1 Tax=Streptomyces prasinus TaxID=67345 RepID=UPI0036D0EA7A